MQKKTRSAQGSPSPNLSASSASAAAAQSTVPPAASAISLADTRWRSAYGLIPALLALLASINTLWNGFATDDLPQILNNAFIRKFSNLPLAFATSVWSFATEDITYSTASYYRPFLNVLFTINYWLFGAAAWGWHLMNALLHTTVTLAVFVTLKELTGRKWTALIAASLWAVHPVHAESVAWISGATDLLMALFLLPAFYFYLRYLKTGRIYLMAVSLGLYFLALLNKETTLALPVVIAYCEIFYFKDSAALKQRLIRGLTLASLFIIPTAVYLFLRSHALSGLLFGTTPRYPILWAVVTIPLATMKYLKLLLVPTGYSYQHYTLPIQVITSVWFLVPLAVVAALAISIWLSRSRDLKFAAFWFIITRAPLLSCLELRRSGRA